MDHGTHASRPISLRGLRRPAFVALAVAVALIAGVVFAAAPSAGARPVWSVAPSADPTGSTSNELFGVSCPSTTSCFAVGFTDFHSLMKHWNGSSWSIVTLPTPAGFSLSDVTCPSTTNCFAVGANHVEHWNGSHWSIMTIPDPPGSVETALGAVSCPSTTNCFAVGNYTIPGGIEKTLVEHWDGSHWSIMTNVPNPSGSILSDLVSLTCPTTTSCFAVGDYFTASYATNPTLVEHWNGSIWKILTAPGDGLLGVSCPSTTSCFAVGYTGNKTLVEHWNGSHWSIMTTPTLAASSLAALRGVSCPTTTSCFAVGDTYTVDGTLVEHWNGSHWSIMTSPNHTGSTTRLNALNGVSCPNTTSCFAVGFYQLSSLGETIDKTLVERYA